MAVLQGFQKVFLQIWALSTVLYGHTCFWGYYRFAQTVIDGGHESEEAMNIRIEN